MNLEKLKDTARKYEQKEDWRKALEVYLRAIDAFESGADTLPDLSLYNRVGDLYMKINDTASAVRSYERAVELYAEQGFANNAIALCGKVLRVNPGRTKTYLTLAQLHARKNVVVDAKRNLLEYLDRMNGKGQREEAFQAVREFADAFSANRDIRTMLTELFRAGSRSRETRQQLEVLADELEAKGDEAGARRTRQRMQAIEDDGAPAQGRPGDLVFLDVGGTRPPVAPAETPATVEPAAPPAETAAEPEADLLFIAPEPLEGLEPTSPAPDLADVDEPETIGDFQLAEVDPGLLGDEAPEPLAGFIADREEFSPEDAETPDQDLAIEHTMLSDPAEATDLTASGDTGLVSDLTLQPTGEQEEEPPVRATDPFGLVATESTGLVADLTLQPDAPVPSEETDDPLDLRGQASSLAAAAEGLAAAPAEPLWTAEDLTPPAEPVAAAPEAEADDGPSMEELEDAILDDPDNPDHHRRLGETLIARGEAARGAEELDLALQGYEGREDWSHAGALVAELIRLDPSNIRFYQKQVELAYRLSEKGALIEAYLELGDALVRMGALDKAMAVYGRVAEHDPDNARATAALDALAPPPPPEPPAAPAMVRPEPAPRESGFIDLGALVLEADEPKPKDTRLRVEDEEPTGDEQADFEQMLAQFKRGIDENLGAEDFQAHYDLGVAFKEMGLLDEAIAEFQKALRAPEGRLRTSEALGSAFFEKGQFAVAEAILGRAVEGLPGLDDEKIGLIYWLGRAKEEQGRPTEARALYQRALAVDITFMDLSKRIKALPTGPAA